MLKILKYIKPKEWAMVAVGFLFIVLQVGLDLLLPDFMSKITTLVQTPGSTMGAVMATGGKMLLCALGSVASAIVIGYLAARIAAGFGRRLRSMMFEKVDSFSMEEMNRFSTSSLITRSTNDVTQVQMVITMGMQVLIKAPITAIWAITKIAGKGFEWTAATCIAIALMVVLLTVIIVAMMPKFKKVQAMTDNLNRVTRENLTGLRVVRAYNADDYQEAKFKNANDELTNTQLFTGRVTSVMMPAMSLIMNGLSLAIYWIGAVLINSAAAASRLTYFSSMVVFSSYAMQVVMAFMMLVIVFILLPRASVSASRINEVLDTELSIRDGAVSDSPTNMTGQVEFRNVSFQYSDSTDYAIRDISFTANKGETVAFIGSTGSGKSTLINLIPRFYDATEGQVLVDGVDVKDYKLEALYNKIGYVPQKAVLFQGSVSSNVAFGDGTEKPTEEDVKTAVSIAQGSDFVEKMDGQYEAHIAQGATNVSGGQKQRLSIARAVCRKPEIYIFDDSFSALDYKTDRVLRSELKRQTQGVTSLIVAQRIGTIMDADQIIVLDDGETVGHGTHDELLKGCEVYRQIARSQLSEEELSV